MSKSQRPGSTANSGVRKEEPDCIFQRLRNAVISNKPNKNIFFIFGASGDLAKKKIYPTLWSLYRDGLLPENILFIGYARSKLTVEKLFENADKFMKVKDDQQDAYKKFIGLNSYVNGAYDIDDDFKRLHEKAIEVSGSDKPHRVFYLALPPSVYASVSELISKHCRPKAPGWLRLIVEKPFGKDLESSNELSKHLSKHYNEDEIYRIDHYLGKEMVQNIIVLRFANRIFSRVWNRDAIAAVMIIFKEDIGTQGRGGYFDEFGIIRDVIQNHLMQILTIVAMEPPLSATGEHIRDEKVKVLRHIQPIKMEDVVLGQYTGDETSTDEERRLGYLDDKGVPADSKTPTYAQVIMHINNERWEGVPFILRAGKALNERKAEIRIQFREMPAGMFEDAELPSSSASGPAKIPRDELVIRVQPNEAVYLKISTKRPGEMGFIVEETELDLTYNERYEGVKLPDAYERLILDVFMGQQINFVRSDELEEAWRIVDPILAKIDKKSVNVIPYVFGSVGLKEAFDATAKVGYRHTGTYVWKDERSASVSNAANKEEQQKPKVEEQRPASAAKKSSSTAEEEQRSPSGAKKNNK